MTAELKRLQHAVDQATTDITRVDALNALAFLMHVQDLERCGILAQQAYELAESAGYTAGTAEALRILSVYHELKADFDTAQKHAEQALALFEALGDLSGAANCHTNLGLIYWSLGQYSKAQIEHLQALNAAAEVGDETIQAKAHNNVALIYWHWGEYDVALTHLYAALDIEGKDSQTHSTGNIYNNIGMIYGEQGYQDKALKYLLRSMTIRTTIGDRMGMGVTYTNLAGSYFDLGNLDAAEAYYTRALRIYEKHERKGVLHTYNHLGGVHHARGDYEQAIRFYKKALALSAAMSTRWEQAESHVQLAMTYLTLGQLDQAQHHLETALPIAEANDARKTVIATLKEMAHLYELRGSFAHALHYYKRYTQAKEAVFNADKTRIIAEMQERYHSDESAREAAHLRLRASDLERMVSVRTRELERALGREHHLAQQLKNALATAKDLSSIQTKVIETVSHEFRTPLAIINSSVGLLYRYSDRLTEEQRSTHFSRIHESVLHITTLIEDILQVRQTHHIVEQQPVRLDFATLCADLQHTLVTDYGTANLIQVQCTSTEGDGGLLFLDGQVVQRIAEQFVSNAVKFSQPASPIDVTLALSDEWLTLTVRDYGRGIAEEDRPHVFDLFYRGSNSVDVRGLGVGLSIAYTLVSRSGGHVRLENAEGGGCIATARLLRNVMQALEA